MLHRPISCIYRIYHTNGTHRITGINCVNGSGCPLAGRLGLQRRGRRPLLLDQAGGLVPEALPNGDGDGVGEAVPAQLRQEVPASGGPSRTYLLTYVLTYFLTYLLTYFKVSK